MSLRKCLLPVFFVLSSLPFASAEDAVKPFQEQVKNAQAILLVKVVESHVAKATEGKTSPIDTLVGKCEVVATYKKKPYTAKSVEILLERKQQEFELIRENADYVVVLDKLPKDGEDKPSTVKAVYPVKDGMVADPENKEKQITLEDLHKKISGHENGHG